MVDWIRRHVSSLIHAMVLAASAIRPMRTSAEGSPSAAATVAWSCCVNTLRARRVARWSSTRASSNTEYAASMAGLVVGEEHAVSSLGPLQRVDVTHPAASLLQIRLEEEGDLPGGSVTGVDLSPELVEPSPSVDSPLLLSALRQLCRDALVTADEATAQECGRGGEVVSGEAHRLAHRAHAVTELQPLIPDRVPDPVGDVIDVDPLVVHQHEVDVARRAQLRSSVAADGDQRHTRAGRRSPRRTTRRPTDPRFACTARTTRGPSCSGRRAPARA